jgi:hypothetical protein
MNETPTRPINKNQRHDCSNHNSKYSVTKKSTLLFQTSDIKRGHQLHSCPWPHVQLIVNEFLIFAKLITEDKNVYFLLLIFILDWNEQREGKFTGLGLVLVWTPWTGSIKPSLQHIYFAVLAFLGDSYFLYFNVIYNNYIYIYLQYRESPPLIHDQWILNLLWLSLQKQCLHMFQNKVQCHQKFNNKSLT